MCEVSVVARTTIYETSLNWFSLSIRLFRSICAYPIMTYEFLLAMASNVKVEVKEFL